MSEWRAPSGRIWNRRALLRRAGRTGLLIGASSVLPGLIGCAEAERTLALAAGAASGRLRKHPWLGLTAAGTARLRFETDQDVAHAVRIEGPGLSTEMRATTLAQDLEFRWPPYEIDGVLQDVRGLHVLQDAEVEGLRPGEIYTWTVDTADGDVTGSFRASPASGTPFSFGFVADTMVPIRGEVLALLTAEAPDLLLHGGDLQYQINPSDTWNGLFAELAPLTSKAALHVCAGNHEYEEMDEFDVMYSRLFGAQTREGNVHRHAFRYGGLHVVIWNSERDFEGADDTEVAWLDRELAAAAADPEVQRIVVMFHRPFWTLGHHRPRLDARERLHTLFVEHGVSLVLTGHNHAYERFLVDGITYIVDGGGGAIAYDVDEGLEEIAAERPEEPGYRQAAEGSYGALIVDVEADGTMRGRRLRQGGGISDSFEI